MSGTGWYTIRAPQMRELAAQCEDLSNAAGEVVDALAEYEDAENADDRSDARESFAQAISDLRATAKEIEAKAAEFEDDA